MIELEGDALDRAVAHAEGIAIQPTPTNQRPTSVWWFEDTGHWASQLMPYAPSRRWDLAGPIIEREMICLIRAAFPDPEHGHMPWVATSVEDQFEQYGDTAIEAAMRCYVAMKAKA